MADLTFAAMVCKPSCTNELKESIIESFGKAQRFYKKNRGKLLYEIDCDTPKAILEDFLRPYFDGTAFSRHREHYKNVLTRFNSYFDKLHMGTIDCFEAEVDRGFETEDIRTYNRLFNQFRGTLLNLVQLTAESIDIWYERTELWDWQYSLIFPELASERRV